MPWISLQFITGLTRGDKQALAPTFTPTGNLELLIRLTCMWTVGEIQRIWRDTHHHRENIHTERPGFISSTRPSCFEATVIGTALLWRRKLNNINSIAEPKWGQTRPRWPLLDHSQPMTDHSQLKLMQETRKKSCFQKSPWVQLSDISGLAFIRLPCKQHSVMFGNRLNHCNFWASPKKINVKLKEGVYPVFYSHPFKSNFFSPLYWN